MAKFKSGDVINYNNKYYRIRMTSTVGFENHNQPNFYDLTDINNGNHLCLPVYEVDEGQKAVFEEGEWQVPTKYETVTIAEKVETSMQTYWEQMESKIEIPKDMKEKFEKEIQKGKVNKKSTKFTTTLANLWRKS